MPESILKRQLMKLGYEDDDIRVEGNRKSALLKIGWLVRSGIPFIAFVDGNLNPESQTGEDGNKNVSKIHKSGEQGVSVAFSGTNTLLATDVPFAKQSLEIPGALESAVKRAQEALFQKIYNPVYMAQ